MEKVVDYDVVFILGYTKILKDDFLSKNKLNLVIHESDLPNGKGFSPVQWQILKGNNVIPVCLIEATEKVDSGDILLKNHLLLNGYELWNEIRVKQAETTLRLISNFLNQYPNYEKQAQIGEGHVYRKRTTKDDELDVKKSIIEQFNHFRIADNDNYPIYFYINKNKYYIKVYRDNNR